MRDSLCDLRRIDRYVQLEIVQGTKRLELFFEYEDRRVVEAILEIVNQGKG